MPATIASARTYVPKLSSEIRITVWASVFHGAGSER